MYIIYACMCVLCYYLDALSNQNIMYIFQTNVNAILYGVSA